jgi:hypothetical protein
MTVMSYNHALRYELFSNRVAQLCLSAPADQ